MLLYIMISYCYDVAGMRRKIHYIQTIDIFNVICYVVVNGYGKWYRNKQYFYIKGSSFRTTRLIQNKCAALGERFTFIK